MRRYFDFVGISENDKVLDVACGSGDFSVFIAKRVKRVCGVDISGGMIKIAKKQARINNLDNIHFECHDVEHLPHESHSFTVVVCKSAFHHMKNYDNVFKEMIRCCRKNKFAILSIEAPVWQGAKALGIPRLTAINNRRNTAQPHVN